MNRKNGLTKRSKIRKNRISDAQHGTLKAFPKLLRLKNALSVPCWAVVVK